MPGVTAYTATGSTLSVASGRISYTFGMRGPAMTVDTACSSSLVSLHTAMNALRMHQCDVVVNGGVNLMLVVETPAAFAKSGMLSVDGRCKTLDGLADGYVRAEAAGAYLIEMYPDDSSSAARKNPLGALISTAVNQDGRSSSLTAPNGPAQQDVLRSAIHAASITPNDLSAIEMHGTGTGLGDPIEVGALAAVMENRTLAQSSLTLMAGKSLMGHSEPSAGVMGIAHAQLSSSQAVSLPFLHLHSINQYVVPSLKQGMFAMARQVTGQSNAYCALAAIGISSFAFQGTNAHAIIDRPTFGDNEEQRNACISVWRRSRYWVHVPLHAALSRVSAYLDLVAFDVDFMSPKLSGIPHIVHIGKDSIVSMAFVNAIATSSACTLSNERSEFGFADVALTAPQFSNARMMRCLAFMKSGNFEVVSYSSQQQSWPCAGGRYTKYQKKECIPVIAPASTRSTIVYQRREMPWSQAVALVEEAHPVLGISAVLESVAPILHPGGLLTSVASTVLQNRSSGVDGGFMVLDAATSRCKVFKDQEVLLQSRGFSTRPLNAMKRDVHPSLIKMASVLENEMIYETLWLADMPSALICPSATQHQSIVVPNGSCPSSIFCLLLSGMLSSGYMMAKSSSPASAVNRPVGTRNSGGLLPSTGAAIQGMLKAVAHEIPGMQLGIDFCGCENEAVLVAGDFDALLGSNVYGKLRLASADYVPRLCPSNKQACKRYSSRLTGPYLLTGGSGALAGHVACWLMQIGVSDVILVSRSGTIPSGTVTMAEDNGLRDNVSSIKGDTTMPSDIEEALIGNRYVRGMVHAGGVLRDATLQSQTATAIRQVQSSKVASAKILLEISEVLALDRLLFFSSVASLLGSPGQSNYGAANAVLDSLAQDAHIAGTVVTSIQWGAWSNAGMATRDKSTAQRLERMGLYQIDVPLGLNALESVLHSSGPVYGAIPIMWSNFLQAAKKPISGFFSEFSSRSHETIASEPVYSVEDIAHHSDSAVNLDVLQGQVAVAVKEILGSEVPATEPLMAAGLDSLGSVELRNSLENSLGVELPSTLVFDYPTISGIAGYLADKLGGQQRKVPGIDSMAPLNLRYSMQRTLDSSKLVILANSAWKSPSDVYSYYKQDICDAVAVVPYERWDVEVGNPLAARFGAYLPDSMVSFFDAAAFNIPETEASVIDPQQRLLLEAMTEAVSYTQAAVPLSQRGVYVGLASSDYGSLVGRHTDKGAFHATSNAISVACGRISFTFGMRGASVSIDTACSASLVAVHLAARDIAEGRLEASYAAGVHLQCTSTSTSYVWAASMLSPVGRCQALDASADGYVRGELCAVMSLIHEDLIQHQSVESKALAILGSSVNQDGRSSSLTAPNGPAQQEAIRAAYGEANVLPGVASSLSMHGTGTSLGDPIEIGAAMAVYSSSREKISLSLMASKSWVGHGEPAAGLAGLLFTNRTANASVQIPLLHLRSVNPYVVSTLDEYKNRSGSVAMLPRTFAPCSSELASSIHGVSAFAFQGTNAHAVVRSGAEFSVSTIPPVFGAVWKHRRYHVLPELNSLLRVVNTDPKRKSVSFLAELETARLSFLWDHKVKDASIFPGAGYFEVCCALAREMQMDHRSSDVVGIVDAVIPSPMILPQMQAKRSRVVLKSNLDVREGKLSLESFVSAKSVHIAAQIASLKKEVSDFKGQKVAHHQLSSLIKQRIGVVGPRASSAVASLNAEAQRTGMSMDPGFFDSFLQLGQVFKNDVEEGIFVPAGLDSLYLELSASHLPSSWATAAPLRSTDVVLTDYHMSSSESCSSVCTIRGLEAKSMGHRPAPNSRVGSDTIAEDLKLVDTLYEVIWQTSATNPSSFASSEDASCQIMQNTDILSPYEIAAGSIGVVQKLIEDAASSASIGLQTMGGPQPQEDLAVCRHKDIAEVSVSSLRGMIRTLNQECPQVRWQSEATDKLDARGSRDGLKLLYGAQILDSDAFGVSRLRRTTLVPRLLTSRATPALGPYQLLPIPRGSLTSLVPQPVPINAVMSDTMLVVDVKAVGINFRDVLNVLGMYPGDPGPPGGDCAGVVVSGNVSDNGSIVAGPGDSVFGLAAGSLGSHVIASNQTMVPMPPNLSFLAASSIPTVFVTVDSALDRIADVRKNDCVMVHAAAGGVGLAAMQIVQAIGAKAIATAGNTMKRSLLRKIGTQVALNSRDTCFTTEMLTSLRIDCNQPRVILNTLTSPGMVSASLTALSRGGVFVEISKRDIWSGARVAQERPDVTYSLLAVDFMSEEALHESLMRISAGISSQVLSPLPTISHSMGAIVSALRQMSQARHVGKIVVRPDPPLRYESSRGSAFITGGTGALGSLVSLWLLRQQVRSMILAGRSGLFASEQYLSEIVSHLATITIVKCDASLSGDTACLNMSQWPQISALWHAGGVLADSTVATQTASGVKKVFAPKVTAIQKLIDLLSGSPLQNNFLFSSVAALLGSAGQLNYSIANAWLDAYSSQLQVLGHPAISCQFGAWKGAGMAAQSAIKMESMGLGALTPPLGVASLTGMLRAMSATAASSWNLPPQVAISPIDWPLFLSKMSSPLPEYFKDFEHHMPTKSAHAMDEKKSNEIGPMHASANMDAAERKKHLHEEIETAVASILGGTVLSDQPLMAAGLDSLGAVELRNSLESRLGIQLPSTLVFDYPTVDAISEFVASFAIEDEEIAQVDSAIIPLISDEDRSPQIATDQRSRPLGISGVVSRTPKDVVQKDDNIDAITTIPLSRWDVEKRLTQDLPSRFSGFLDDPFQFDAATFGTSIAEAILMDPQQRLLLELAQEALYTCSTLERSPSGTLKQNRRIVQGSICTTIVQFLNVGMS